VLYCDGERGLVVSDFRVRGPHPRRPLEPSIHVLKQDYPCVSRCTSARVISSMRLPDKSSGTFPEADPVRGRQVVRAEPMSTLDAELNDFGAQLAMLGGHAADRDG